MVVKGKVRAAARDATLTKKVPRAVKWRDRRRNSDPYDLVSSMVSDTGDLPTPVSSTELGIEHKGPVTKLFVCYLAVTALTERFCQNAYAPEANGGQVQSLQLAGLGLANCGSNLAADQLLLPRSFGERTARRRAGYCHAVSA
jgi:hypothetical protein